jgi:hypothetical protein
MDQKYNILQFLNKHLKIINRVQIQSQASIDTFKKKKIKNKNSKFNTNRVVSFLLT